MDESKKLSKQILAIFDFDGTLTTKDTFKDFLRYAFGFKKFVQGLFANSILLSKYLSGIVTNSYAKERFFSYFFKGMPFEEFDYLCRKYAENQIGEIMRKETYEQFKEYKEKKADVVIVSATLETYLTYWAKRENVPVVATKIEIEDGVLTGRFASKNCYGPEKVRRLKNLVDLGSYSQIVAFGDSRGDKELFDIAHKAFFKGKRIK